MALEQFNRNSLEERLKGSERKAYLGIIETYAVNWSIEKAARDTLQNFFDANNRTLDGIETLLTRNSGVYTVRINGEKEYDYRLLLHLGATSKAHDHFSSGGFGEGAKILALSLLRDYCFSQVRFGSSGWQVDFLLEPLDESLYIENVRGLFAAISKPKHAVKGNFVEFKTSSKDYAQAFVDARELFYHKENKDFAFPTLDVPSVGGFKFLGGKVEGKEPAGNLYIAGQRRNFQVEKWNTVEFANIWAHNKELVRPDRDRGIVPSYELIYSIIPAIVNASGTQQAIDAVYSMEPIWTDYTAIYETRAGQKMLECLVEKLAKENVKLPFEEKYVAAERFMPDTLLSAFASHGYKICAPFFASIGMTPIMERFKGMCEHFKTEPSPKEKVKMDILYCAANKLGKEPKDIWLFKKENEKSFVLGSYAGTFVWMDKERLNGSFNKAFATYLHELDHKYGSDYSADFSYALTDTIEVLVAKMLGNAEEFRMLESLWNKLG